MSSGRALRLHFSVVDKWGQRVDILRHPEMAGQEELVKQAISAPQIVYEGTTADDRMFRGEIITGSGFSLGGKVVIAVVNYTAGSKFLTAYTTTLDPKGRVLWKRAP